MAFLFKLASSFNSDFSLLLPTGEHLFACQNVRQGGKRYFSFSGWSLALRCKGFAPSPWPSSHPSHLEEGESERWHGGGITPGGSWPLRACACPVPLPSVECECVRLSLPRHVAGGKGVCGGRGVRRWWSPREELWRADGGS